MLFDLQSKFRLLKLSFTQVRTATKRASGGHGANNNTAGRRLGPKKGEGELVKAGDIIYRQRGTVFYPGENAGIGRDHTIFAKEPGYVRFYRDPFHAKRRFIGIALDKEGRLPTPHFAPRRRRFGYKVIDNEEVAEFERQYITKKELEKKLVRDKLYAQRQKARQQRLESYRQTLTELCPELTPKDLDFEAARFDKIYQYTVNGRHFAESRAIVDGEISDDLALDLRVGRISQGEFDAKLAELQKSRSITDAKVVLGANCRMTAAVSEAELAKQREAAIAEIEALVKGLEYTPQAVVDKVVAVLSAPIFDQGEQTRLKRKYLRRPVPQIIPQEAIKEFEARVQKGEGKILPVWNYERGGADKYFVPNGAAMIFS